MTVRHALAGAMTLACISTPAIAYLGDTSAVSFNVQEAARSTDVRSARLHYPYVTIRDRRHWRTPGGDMLRGVFAPLAVKAREIMDSCGSRVVSGVRHTRVAGSGRMSLHASGHAVDMQGNPSCIYARLRGWPGGVSTDYARAPGGAHVHFSLGGREDGLRFAHYQNRRVRYAMR